MQPGCGLNGVFAGGGIKGVGLAGAAAAAMERGHHFQHLVGTSSGALVASLIAAGYTAAEMATAVRRVPWPRLFPPHALLRVPVLGKGLALGVSRALYSGDNLEATWSGLLAAKGVHTFADLPEHRLRVITTDITQQRGVVLPDDLPVYGIDPARFRVSRAVRMSASVPFFLEPVAERHPDTGEVSLFVDGALTTNFPLLVARWSPVEPIIGFRFREQESPKRSTLWGPAALARAVVTAGIKAADTLHAPERDGLLIVKVPIDRDPLDFDVSPDHASALFEAGRREAQRLFDLWSVSEGATALP